MSAEEWMQLTLDDALTAQDIADARADGIGRAEANAAATWRLAAQLAVLWCMENHETFTSDEVLVRLAAVDAPATHNLSALGPVFLAASRARLIVKTGAQRPSRFTRRHRDLTVWRARSSSDAPSTIHESTGD